LVEKFFELRKTENVTMDAHLTKVKNVANTLEEVGIVLLEEIVVYYTIAHLPEEYKVCKCMLLN
jgi:hypothetical protein